MTVSRVPEALLQQEVRELTGLLRTESSFEDLRELLAAKGLPASRVVLAGLIEGEDMSRFGAILTPGHECILFEAAPDGSLTRWEPADDPGALTYAFTAVPAGIRMMRSGQIS